MLTVLASISGHSCYAIVVEIGSQGSLREGGLFPFYKVLYAFATDALILDLEFMMLTYEYSGRGMGRRMLEAQRSVIRTVKHTRDACPTTMRQEVRSGASPTLSMMLSNGKPNLLEGRVYASQSCAMTLNQGKRFKCKRYPRRRTKAYIPQPHVGDVQSSRSKMYKLQYTTRIQRYTAQAIQKKRL